MGIDLRKVKRELEEEKGRKTTLKSFRFSSDLYSKFEKKCKKDGFTTARVIEKLMEHYLDHQG